MKVSLIVKIVFFFFLILTGRLVLSAKEPQVISSWAINPVKVDGSADDWTDVSFHSEKKLSIDYAFKNDGQHLFIIFKFKDPRYLSTIRETGITIWFNLEGKRKKHYGLNFVKEKLPAEAFISYLEHRKGPLSEEEKNNIKRNPFYFIHRVRVINKKAKSSASTSGQEVELAVFRQSVHNKEVVYEFSIPLKRETAQTIGVGSAPGKVVKVGFEWGGLTAQMKAARAARSQLQAETPMRPAVSPQSAIDRGTGARGTPRIGLGAKKYLFWVDVELAAGSD